MEYPALHENIDRIIVEQLKELKTTCKKMVCCIASKYQS